MPVPFSRVFVTENRVLRDVVPGNKIIIALPGNTLKKGETKMISLNTLLDLLTK
jgi:hypothetical protein